MLSRPRRVESESEPTLARILAFDPRYKGPKKVLLRVVWLLSVLGPLAFGVSMYLRKDISGSNTGAALHWEITTVLRLGSSFWTAVAATVCAFGVWSPAAVPARAKQSAIVAILIAWVSFGIFFRFALYGKLF